MPLAYLSHAYERQQKLWFDHVRLTRLFLISYAQKDSASIDRVSHDLMRNQEAIGSDFGEYFGVVNGMKITKLLKEHIAAEVEYVKAAYANNGIEQRKAISKLLTNVDKLFSAISKLNRLAWPVSHVEGVLTQHVVHTKSSVDARVKGDWEGDHNIWRAIQDNAMQISSMVANGFQVSIDKVAV